MTVILKTGAFALAMTIAASSAQAVTTLGFLNTDATIDAGGAARGVVDGDLFENFGSTSGTVTVLGQASALFTATINPYLPALSGGGFSNSVSISYALNDGPETILPIEPTLGTGAGRQTFTLAANDVLRFGVSGEAGREGNLVTLAVSTVSTMPAAIPLPAGAALFLSAFAALGLVRRRRVKAA